MLQRITHGAKIDAATPAEVAALIAKAQEAQTIEQFYRAKGVISLDATGAGQASLDVSAQYDWLCERITVSAVPAAAALINFYENQPTTADLLEVIQLGTAGLYSDAFANKLYVPANSQLVIVVTGGTANGSATFNIQIKLLHKPKK